MHEAINLGLKADRNLLAVYDPLWPAAFEEEKTRLEKALGPVAKGIEHYGSTAVPGLCAKPILDIMVGVLPLAEWEKCRPALEALGYDYAEGAGVPGHYIFGRGRDRTERTHLVHVVEYQGESWRGSLAFRDALRRDASLRESYAQEKERAAAAAPGNRAAYNLKKGPFIAESIKKLVGRESMPRGTAVEPDGTAVRVALWRAMHVQVDSPPHVLEDEVGLKLADPPEGWLNRPDMGPFTQPFRASILARARFLEDLLAEQSAGGVGQYVILGAGLDTFAQRRLDLASRLVVFEVDQPGPQAWKRQRLADLGFGVPSFLRLVPVDFESGDTWWAQLTEAGFDATKPAVVASTGVSMYLTREAIAATLRRVASLAPGSALVMSFLLPIELTAPEVRPGIERAAEGARADGTPFLSFFTPEQMLALARSAGFRNVQHVSSAALAERYFAGRTDGLRPPDNTEELLVATT